MSASVSVRIHPSQFPDRVAAARAESFRSRRINHKFHYESHRQAQRWLAVYRSYCPFTSAASVAQLYDDAFAAVAQRVGTTPVEVIGLGCGPAEKELPLLRRLPRLRAFHPWDVSVPLVVQAVQNARAIVPAELIFPVSLDLALADDAAELLPAADGPRVFTFFGMLPNFEASNILPGLRRLLQPGDWLLFSANLAPGDDYEAGARSILPLYDNAETREWLLTMLLDSGIERGDGELRFDLRPRPAPVLSITASFTFGRSRVIEGMGEPLWFEAGETLQVFFSCRHSPALAMQLFHEAGLRIEQHWVEASGQEGVFLARVAG